LTIHNLFVGLRPEAPNIFASGTAPALFGEATADQTASCVEQPSVRSLNSHGDGFGKATSVILVAALGARYAASQRGTAACPEEAE
jgi:hypothetical protein